MNLDFYFETNPQITALLERAMDFNRYLVAPSMSTTRVVCGWLLQPNGCRGGSIAGFTIAPGRDSRGGSPTDQRNGDIRWLYVKNHPVLDSSAQRVIGVLGVGQDITQRKLTEEALRTHGILLEAMHEGVLLFDCYGLVHFVNRAARQMLQLGTRTLASISVSQIGLAMDFIPDPPSAITEQVCKRSNGSEFLAKIAYIRLVLRGQRMIVAIFQDNTAQKQLKQAVIKVATRVQQRIAVDLHDGLGQELAGAALMLRSLAERLTKSSPEYKHQIEEIIAITNGAIQEVRILARGLSPVELEGGDLCSALSALAARIRIRYRIQVDFRCDYNRDSVIATEVANHLYWIAQEAVSNAVRHSSCTCILIRVTRPHDLFELTVEDNGSGMPRKVSSPSGMGWPSTCSAHE